MYLCMRTHTCLLTMVSMPDKDESVCYNYSICVVYGSAQINHRILCVRVKVKYSAINVTVHGFLICIIKQVDFLLRI